MLKRATNETGFTLSELLISLAILGLISTLPYPKCCVLQKKLTEKPWEKKP